MEYTGLGKMIGPKAPGAAFGAGRQRRMSAPRMSARPDCTARAPWANSGRVTCVALGVRSLTGACWLVPVTVAMRISGLFRLSQVSPPVKFFRVTPQMAREYRGPTMDRAFLRSSVALMPGHISILLDWMSSTMVPQVVSLKDG